MNAPGGRFSSRQPQNRERRLIELSLAKITVRRVSPQATDILRYYRNIRQFHLERESRSTFAAQALSVMGNEDKSAMERGKPKRERTLRILQLNLMPYQSLLSSLLLSYSSYSFSLFSLSPYDVTRTPSLYDHRYSRITTVSPFSLFSFLSFVIQYTAAYDRNLNPLR